MTPNEVRKRFLDFFASRGHRTIASDSLVPKEDPTVLFTTAGMQQFKRQFLGHLEGYARAASCQKCLRTDDLNRVGKTPYHHTFFEMLGNFSFGDYFKKEAISWAWEFLTKDLKIPSDRLWVSVYEKDQEAETIWRKDIGIPRNRFLSLGDKTNFWPSEAKAKGPNGPCGPCSEIFYDYGPNPDCKNPDCNPSCECGRFSEIWNLVFTQFNRKEGGILEPLPSKNIDTGMGLERLVAVLQLQGKKSNFETDLFKTIIRRIDEKPGVPLEKKYILADHMRAVVFAINDGVIPSNKEKGSVVKRLICICTDIVLRHRNSSEAFLQKLAEGVIDIMQEPYPELVQNRDQIKKTIQNTAQAYASLLNERIPLLEKELQEIKNDRALSQEEKIRGWGRAMFAYYDTHGLAIDAIRDAFKAEGIDDHLHEAIGKEFEKHMAEQKERSRSLSKMTGEVFKDVDLKLDVPKTQFLGYEQVKSTAKILKVFIREEEATVAQKAERIKLVLNQTPFYAEAGGQIGDSGTMIKPAGTIRITDTQKIGDVFVHLGEVLEGTFQAGDVVEAHIDEERRLSIMRNHTATHLLQAALRTVLGPHIKQQGSLVAEDRLRFDFAHPHALAPKEWKTIEELVNSYIMACDPVKKTTMPLKEARETGALAFFAEKYGDAVRVVSVNGYSKELCGGTHLNFTGQIGTFKIVSESAVAQGIRRIEALTGQAALRFMLERDAQLEAISQKLKSPVEGVFQRLDVQTTKLKRLEKEVDGLRLELIKNSLDTLVQTSDKMGKTKIIAHAIPNASSPLLRRACDLLKQKSRSAIILLASEDSEGSVILIGVTDDLVKKGIKADDWVGDIAALIKGSGGGRAELVQLGSKHRVNLEKVLGEAKRLIKKKAKLQA